MPARDDRRQAIALFRYSLIREAADPALSTRERGALVRALAERDHLGPTGEPGLDLADRQRDPPGGRGRVGQATTGSRGADAHGRRGPGR
jgi:hypothetical protein